MVAAERVDVRPSERGEPLQVGVGDHGALGTCALDELSELRRVPRDDRVVEDGEAAERVEMLSGQRSQAL